MDFAGTPVSVAQLLTVLDLFGLRQCGDDDDHIRRVPTQLGVLLAVVEHLVDQADRTHTEDITEGYFSLVQALVRFDRSDESDGTEHVWLRLLGNRMSRTALELRDCAGGDAMVVASGAADAAESACAAMALSHQRRSPEGLMAGFDLALDHLDASRATLEAARTVVTGRQ